MREAVVWYAPRCPACNHRLRERDFRVDPEPITPRDLLGMVSKGRGRFVVADTIAYSDSDPLVGVVRRRWIARLRRALAALESIPAEVVRRFRGLSSYTSTAEPVVPPTVTPPIMLRYGGIHARRSS